MSIQLNLDSFQSSWPLLGVVDSSGGCPASIAGERSAGGQEGEYGVAAHHISTAGLWGNASKALPGYT